jgi:hypothetical protein
MRYIFFLAAVALGLAACASQSMSTSSLTDQQRKEQRDRQVQRIQEQHRATLPAGM